MIPRKKARQLCAAAVMLKMTCRCRDDTSRTSLHWAAETGAADVAAVLVAAEAEAYQTQLQQLEAEAAAAAEVAAQAGIAQELPAQPAKPPTIYELQASYCCTPQHP
jgi:hypothetical protein